MLNLFTVSGLSVLLIFIILYIIDSKNSSGSDD
jgi:hypothetical protein